MQGKERHQHEEKAPSTLDTLRGVHRVMLGLCNIQMTPVVLLRKPKTAGKRFISWHFFVGVGWMFLFEAVFNLVGDHTPIMLLAALTSAFILLHLVKSDRTAHTHFIGSSGLGNWSKVYSFGEPLLLVGVGAALFMFAHSVGLFLILSGVASHLLHSHLDRRDAARVRQFRDAHLDQQGILELYRKENES